ncbi:hypothetical protein BASA83_009331 [Batrachochytrium salamandrivorans]|nr:hypothetical protein BASA83_009331 [Batrachochytrium salamandrivorans]
MLNRLDTLTDNVSQQIVSLVSSFQTALSSIEAKVDSLVQDVDNVWTEVEGTRVDIDTVVEGADSEMCSMKEYLKAVVSSSAIIMSKLEVLGSSPHVPQFLISRPMPGWPRILQLTPPPLGQLSVNPVQLLLLHQNH